jgi:hypothetical protein
MEEEIRKEAISRHLKGEQPNAIYSTLQRSKKWFFKWLKRYKSGVAEWYIEQSRTPLRTPSRIPDDQQQAIILTRNRLEAQPFAQTGVSAIKWELTKQGLSFPSDRTIHRVLKREGLIKKNFLYS